MARVSPAEGQVSVECVDGERLVSTAEGQDGPSSSPLPEGNGLGGCSAPSQGSDKAVRVCVKASPAEGDAFTNRAYAMPTFGVSAGLSAAGGVQLEDPLKVQKWGVQGFTVQGLGFKGQSFGRPKSRTLLLKSWARMCGPRTLIG